MCNTSVIFACQMYDLNLIDDALSLWVKSYDL